MSLILPGGSNFVINLWRYVFQSDCIAGIHNRIWDMFNGEWGFMVQGPLHF